MDYNEDKWLQSDEGRHVLFYQRYVDDIFCVFKNETQANIFLEFLNTRHNNIKFTIEKEIYKKLPFLDILVDKSNDKIHTSIYRKKTYTGLLLNFNSFTPWSYKKGLLKTLIDRTFRINNTWLGFHNDISKLKNILLKNEYPLKQIDTHIRKYLHKQYDNENHTNPSNTETRYYKLPYIGQFSKSTQKRLNNLISRFCKDSVSIKLVFTTFKLSSIFSTKNKVPSSLKSFVVYKFECAAN